MQKGKHKSVIVDFLHKLNSKYDNYILKGGTALMLCYGLDRFSEDIDLNGSNHDIKKFVDDFCEKNNYKYRIAKDTETVNRFMVHYTNNNKPLKIEISFRQKNIDKNTTKIINGIRVYDIDTICIQKLQAYNQRDKIRDMYDLIYIFNNYRDKLSPITINALTEAMAHKGIEHFDYLIKTQKDDPLVEENKFVENFLKMYDALGLLTTNEEKENAEMVYVTKHIRRGKPVKAHWRKRPNK